VSGRACRPVAIAYPNGNCSHAAVQAAEAAGLRLGFTMAPRRPRLPLDSNSRMLLGRFFFMAARTSGGNAACWVPASFPAIRSRR